MKFKIVIIIIISLIIIGISLGGLYFFGFFQGYESGQKNVWDNIAKHEQNLRNVYSIEVQERVKNLIDENMNYTDLLILESQFLNFNQDRPQYKNVCQVLDNGIGACGEHAYVYAAFCVAKNIPFRIIHLGYFVANEVDHSWVQINPSGDGKTWISIDVGETCDRLDKGQTINGLWGVTIDNNAQFIDKHYKMVLAYELNKNNEIIITDVTSTFS